MPLFTNKFSPKKIPVRRIETSIIKKEFGNEYAAKALGMEVGDIKLQLGDLELNFEENEWIHGNAGSALKDHNMKSKRYIQQLEEENNMLRLKFEILLDILTQTSAQSQEQLVELEKLRHNARKKRT